MDGEGKEKWLDTSRMCEFPIEEFFKQPRSLLGAEAYETARGW
jgi:hypothetical protein